MGWLNVPKYQWRQLGLAAVVVGALISLGVLAVSVQQVFGVAAGFLLLLLGFFVVIANG